MAPLPGPRMSSFLPLAVGLFLAYHAIILVEGGRAITSRLSWEEDLEFERQLNILNKPPIKTMHTRRGAIYDCIEFYKQPAFDHPLLKNHEIPKKDETASPRLHTTLMMSQIEECPKGTVPIRRTTKEDLSRAKYLSSTSNAPGDEYRAGISLQIEGERFFGASGVANIWHPNVNPDQFSGAETALRAGPEEQINEIRFGWTVNPQLYGYNLTSMFAYWTSDGGKTTGCYNTRCPGFVQVDPQVTPDMYIEKTSVLGGPTYGIHTNIIMDRETEHWWLILEDKIKIGYWPKELFQRFNLGAEYIYWGGHVKSGKDGIPEMGSGNLPDRIPEHTGYYSDLEYQDKDDVIWKPDQRVQITVDCEESYGSLWDNEHTILHFGGPGGGTCA
ncbi:hypothetical protein MKW98_015888 [Papaver atlanticum]|uniref:Neprosin PEP catalytic domain-containing protein n=1 Tax=Papaver atlanticum TaxID=357466 RepID=A0AAD4SSI5_9MAGN|nr:hypothetical protein MKW98_015888 [Papaver atlanticum]